MKEVIKMTREATKKEIKAYEKVENILTMEEMEIIFDALDDEQTFDDLLNNKVTDEQIQAIIQEHKISVKELSDWYFTEVED
jgi:hypothetical protein